MSLGEQQGYETAKKSGRDQIQGEGLCGTGEDFFFPFPIAALNRPDDLPESPKFLHQVPALRYKLQETRALSSHRAAASSKHSQVWPSLSSALKVLD